MGASAWNHSRLRWLSSTDSVKKMLLRYSESVAPT
jgi:hypothetical protein